MESTLLSLSKIFTHKIYRIPDYQRGYAWTEKQLVDFWNDIFQLEPGKNHYFGVLTLERVSNESFEKWEDDLWIIESKNYEPYFIVDGQQRLTTSIILIQSIIESAKERANQKRKIELNYTPISDITKQYIYEQKTNALSRSYIFGYEKDNPSYEFLKTKIFKEKSTKGYIREETIYTENLEFAKNFFLEQLKNLKRFSELEQLFNKITQRLLFNIYTISNDIDVYIAFETMNNRGKPLSTLELLKNRFIYLSTKLSEPSEEKENLRRRINDCWKAVYHNLGKNKEAPLNDDDFLINFTRFFLLAELNSKKEIVKYLSNNSQFCEVYLLQAQYTLANIYKNSQNKVTLTSLNEFALSMQESVEVWFEINNPTISKNYNAEEKVLLDRIKRLNFNIVSTLLLLFYSSNPDKELSVSFLNILEKVLFLTTFSKISIPSSLKDLSLSPLNKTSPTLLIHNFLAYELSILNKSIDVNGFIGELLNRYTAKSANRPKNSNEFSLFSDLPENDEGIIANRLNEEDLRISNNEIKIRSFETQFLLDNFNEFILSQTNSYKWKGIKYFLFEYEQFLRAKAKSKQQKIDWIEFNEEQSDFITVEHILPQNNSLACWKSLYSKYNVRQKEILCNSLGNLLALSRPKNASLSNKCFLDKVNDKNKAYSGYKYGSFSEIEVAQNQNWTAKEILLRGMKLLKFMEERWNLKFYTDSIRIRLLRLEFVLDKENITLEELDKP